MPAGWSERGLLSVATIVNGQVNPEIEPFRNMILLAPDHVASATGRVIEHRTAAQQRAISGKYRVNPGDVVYSKIRPHLRKAALATFDGLCSADMYPLKPAQDVDGRFLLATLLSERFSQYAESVSVRSGMPKINRRELAVFSVLLPPKEEQASIGRALAAADNLVVGLDELLRKKRDIARGVQQALLTGRIRLPGFADAWSSVELGRHVRFLKHGVHARAALSAAGTIRYLHYGDIHAAAKAQLAVATEAMPFLPEALAQPLSRLATGDLVFVDASEDLVGVGKSVEVWNPEELPVVSGLHTIAARFDKAVLADGFKAYLQLIPSFARHLRTLAAGTKVLATNRKHIATAVVDLPDTAEQSAIATVLSDLDAELEALEARRAKTLAIKQGMMQALLTGRIRLT